MMRFYVTSAAPVGGEARTESGRAFVGVTLRPVGDHPETIKAMGENPLGMIELAKFYVGSDAGIEVGTHVDVFIKPVPKPVDPQASKK